MILEVEFRIPKNFHPKITQQEEIIDIKFFKEQSAYAPTINMLKFVQKICLLMCSVDYVLRVDVEYPGNIIIEITKIK